MKKVVHRIVLSNFRLAHVSLLSPWQESLLAAAQGISHEDMLPFLMAAGGVNPANQVLGLGGSVGRQQTTNMQDRSGGAGDLLALMSSTFGNGSGALPMVPDLTTTTAVFSPDGSRRSSLMGPSGSGPAAGGAPSTFATVPAASGGRSGRKQKIVQRAAMQ